MACAAPAPADLGRDPDALELAGCAEQAPRAAGSSLHARGEEGSMGNAPVRGPLDNPDPHVARGRFADASVRDGSPSVVSGTAPRPRVRMAGTEVIGRVPPEAVQRVVRSHRGALERCVEDDLRANPPASLRVFVGFTIERDGTTSHVAASGDDAGPKLLACVEHAFSRWVFPEPEGGTVHVNYPVFLPLQSP